jgi:hypothetical protein
MLVPDLIDDLARRDRCRRDDGEKAEAAIGIDRCACLFEVPAMVARQPTGEIQRSVGLEIMPLDSPPQILPRGCPDGLVRLDVDLELRPLQRKLLMIARISSVNIYVSRIRKISAGVVLRCGY